MHFNLKQKFRTLLWRLRCWLGTRYGADMLSRFLSISGFALLLAGRILRLRLVYYIGLIAMLWSVVRSLSPSAAAPRRQRELGLFMRYSQGLEREVSLIMRKLSDPGHKYVKCPNCRKVLRVPKKQGNIVISCPGCGGRVRTRS